MLAQLLAKQEEREAKFAQAMNQLRDPDVAFTADMIYSLSDMDTARLDTFRGIWVDMPVERRRKLIKRLVETAETNFDLDFSAVINPAITDPDPEVRQAAIEGVIEDAPRLVIETLIEVARHDPLSEVREAAAKALGPFVLKGELGKLPQALNQHLQDSAWAIFNDLNEALDVRRRALEALGNCSREGIADLIREAYYDDEIPMKASAIFAMGRSCDEAWAKIILDELTNDQPELRFEAVRAAGELELKAAVPRLIDLAFDGDREIQEMAIWALGEIGGSAAQQTLTELAALADEVDDEELTEAITEAQGAALLAAEDDPMPLLDFSEYDGELDDEHIQVVRLGDLDDEEDEDDEDDNDLITYDELDDLDDEDDDLDD